MNAESPKNQLLKFMLRRIEFDIDAEECYQWIHENLQTGQITFDEIQNILDRDIIHKAKVRNFLDNIS